MKIILIAVSALFLAQMSFATTYSDQLLQSSEVQNLYSESGENDYTQAAGCYAYTSCSNGGTISCQTYGAACTWNTRIYQSVSCTGYNGFGNWVNFYFTCY